MLAMTDGSLGFLSLSATRTHTTPSVNAYTGYWTPYRTKQTSWLIQ